MEIATYDSNVPLISTQCVTFFQMCTFKTFDYFEFNLCSTLSPTGLEDARDSQQFSSRGWSKGREKEREKLFENGEQCGRSRKEKDGKRTPVTHGGWRSCFFTWMHNCRSNHQHEQRLLQNALQNVSVSAAPKIAIMITMKMNTMMLCELTKLRRHLWTCTSVAPVIEQI